MNSSRFNLTEASTLFIVLAVAFLTLGGFLHRFGFVVGILTMEYVVLLAPILLYAAFKKKDFINVFKLKKIEGIVALKIIGLAIILVPIVAFANLVALFIIEQFSSVTETPIPVANSFGEYLVLFFVIAITAGICEEFFFRGMILDAFENETNLYTAAVLSAVLFAVFHFNPQNFFGPLILGFVFSYLTQVTGSIWAAVIAHIANNGIAVTMGYVLNFSGSNEGQLTQIELLQSPGIMLSVLIFYAVLSGFSFLLAKAMLKSIQQHFPRLEVGDRFTAKGKSYKIIALQVGQLSFSDVSDEHSTFVSTIEQVKANSTHIHYSIWKNDKIQFPPLSILMITIGSLLYALVTFYTFF
jgi:membrane protease YdiL (CAAX protease family)